VYNKIYQVPDAFVKESFFYDVEHLFFLQVTTVVAYFAQRNIPKKNFFCARATFKNVYN